MGNTFQTPAVEAEQKQSLYVTGQERLHLQNVYTSCTNQNGTLSGDKIRTVFEALHGREIFGAALTDYILLNCNSYELFETFVVNCTRQSANTTITTMWHIAQCNAASVPAMTRLERFLHIVFALAMDSNIQEAASSKEVIDAAVSRLKEFVTQKLSTEGIHSGSSENEAEYLSNLLSVINSYVPNLAVVLESHISRVCFGALLSPSHRLFQQPTFDIPSEIVNAYDLLPLALHNEALQGSWKRLYSTSVDGQSFNRIAYHILGYDGPTCVLIKCQDPQSTVLGILAYDRWKDSNRFYGSSKNALFVVSPKLRIYRSKGASSGAYQWLNTKAVTLPHGLGFGGTVEGFRVFIPESLEECVAIHSCPTYETGKLVEGETFHIHTLEIWGCGGSAVVASALQAQAKDRAVVDENIRKARQVDKAQFFNNEFDKEFFLSNTTSYGTKERSGHHS